MVFLDTILSVAGKETIKRFFNAYVVPLFIKDGKVHPKRMIVIAFIILLGFISFHAPSILPKIYVVFNDLNTVKEIPTDSFFFRLQDAHYYALSRYVFVLSYLTFILFAWSIVLTKKSNKFSMQTQEMNVALFANDTGLIEGSRCLNTEEQDEVVKKVAGKIDDSTTCRFMLINGYHNFTDPDSLIRVALESKKKSLNLKLLMLDPFSSYAKKRADVLLPETDERLSQMRYIRDFFKVLDKVDALKKAGASVECKVYCSKPFFRLYLFDKNDLIFQAYQDNMHGHHTPMYHYIAKQRSLFHLGRDIFNYHWNRSFKFDEKSLMYYGKPFIFYLAKMYGVLEDNENNADILCGRILEYVESMKAEAEKLESDGFLTDFED